ncbi:endoglucanase 11-like isoform X1 [Zingiber officinale]|uniref:cellulase n=1 Tax=Zingiber officinale TaxID=94328 RepID=A0A8J5FID1_ZINOF|nr:endoglucanase 11-like isoform X1 [Zingiber officinale]KAG6486338.1 hypothetical protein ZIOFF_054908 [Zingiber officinale]
MNFRWRIRAVVFVFLLVTASAFDYKDALSKSLLYFEAQRSGRLPYNQRVTWRSHSGLIDGLQQGVDLVGGYYDAGDHVKFGLPMAFTVTLLSWSVMEYGEQIAAAGEYGHALEAIKWGTDYFIKAHAEREVLWVEVGDGDTDHYCWQRSEDMTTSRKAYKIDSEHPGSDVAGETAAAMAAAAVVFRRENPRYAEILLRHARELFEFADGRRGRYDGSVREARRYYPSWSGYEDELLWAALWMHKATGREEYVDYVVEKAEEFGGIGWAMTEFSWDVKFAGVQILASKLLVEGNLSKKQRGVLEQYRSKAEHYICSCLNKNNGSNVHRTPGGMLFVREWNNMQYVANAAFLLSVYSDHLSKAGQQLHCPNGIVTIDDLRGEAKAQVDYLLGSNPLGISYLVGYGPKYPTKVHHRGASIVSYKRSKGFIGCMQGYYNWYARPDPNPNIIIGALVGGPDSKDRFKDDRMNYMQTEACTYNTAPLVGVFAKLDQHIQEVSNSTTTFSS